MATADHQTCFAGNKQAKAGKPQLIEESQMAPRL